MEGSKTLFFSSEFPYGHKSISLKFVESLGTCPEKGSPAVLYNLV